MAMLTRWNPARDMLNLRDAMDRLLDERSGWSSQDSGEWIARLPIDAYTTDNEIVVTAAVPGVKPDEVEITVTEGVLTIKGEVEHEQQTERTNYYSRQIRYGTFSRSIPLPTRVNHEEAKAEFENGILTVSLPKAEEVRPKMIKVQAVSRKPLAGAGHSSN